MHQGPGMRAPWAQPPSANVPHAFVPHQDVMSPTGAPWASNAASMKPAKPPARLVAAGPTLPPPALEIPGVAELAGVSAEGHTSQAETGAAAAAGASSSEEGAAQQPQGPPLASGGPEAEQPGSAAGASSAAAPAGPASAGERGGAAGTSGADAGLDDSSKSAGAAAAAAGTSDTSAPYPARKAIMNAADLTRFLESDSARSFMSYLLALNEACAGKKLSQLAANPSPAVQRLVTLLDTLNTWVDEIPPVEQSLRYGNPAFRTWHARLVESAPSLLKSVMPEPLAPLAEELAPYLWDSFGNATRIDYGTGHETTFAALLYCLTRLRVLGSGDSAQVVGAVFAKYLTLMRRIQTTYWLEPAGSHGVWGLDDYQFLPFIWGAAQLMNHPMIRPKSIHNSEVMDTYAHEYLYLGAVQFVKQVKKGPLQETSPMLCDIAQVPNWVKVNSGMVKMYQAEVLSKFPIMQHFLFCRLLPMPPAEAPAHLQQQTAEGSAAPAFTTA